MSKEKEEKNNKNSDNTSQTLKQTEMENLKTQLEEEKNRRIKLMADFDNYKKRIESEKATFGAMANMGIIQQILEIYDDLQMALNDSDLDLERARSSIKNAQEKIQGTVGAAGVERIEVNIGDEFDKENMEAIQAVPDEKNKNKVIAVISSAYKYAGQDSVLKAAKVIVGK